MNRPNFFVIGAMKSGTTSLCDLLAEHPDVFVSNPKEPGFFSIADPTAEQLRAYERLFEGASGYTPPRQLGAHWGDLRCIGPPVLRPMVRLGAAVATRADQTTRCHPARPPRRHPRLRQAPSDQRRDRRRQRGVTIRFQVPPHARRRRFIAARPPRAINASVPGSGLSKVTLSTNNSPLVAVPPARSMNGNHP